MVPDVLITIGNHCPPPIPTAFANDVNFASEECVCGPHDCADVEVVLPVLNCDVERVPSCIEVGDDRRLRPVAITINNVATIAFCEQLRVPHRPIGPWLQMWSYADGSISGLRW